MKVTLVDVAQASGVSKATASYVLNNKKSSFGLSPLTVRRVLEESKRLNYRPDLVARALAEKKRVPLSVMVLSPWLHSQFSDFMVQVSHAIEAISREMKVHTDYKLYQVGDLKQTLKPQLCRKYDAVLVLGTSVADDLYLDKNRGDFANIVLLNRQRDGYACSCGNDEDACVQVARRLVAGNYYRKYVLTVSSAASHREQLRIGGYRKVIGRLGGELFFESRNSDIEASADDYRQSMLREYGTDRVCYIFTQYFPAAQFMNCALRAGLAVPDQVGVVGYDQHSLLKDFLQPELTTVDPRIFEMTKQALYLAGRMKDGESLAEVLTEAVIVPGGTAIIG